MLKKYNSMEEYAADPKSTTESTVSLITDGNIVEYDGVNVITMEPKVADVVFTDEEGNVIFISGETIDKTRIPAGWSHYGYVYARRGKNVHIIQKDGDSAKWADVVQFSLTGLTLDGEQHEAAIGLRLTGGTAVGYADNTIIPFTYQGTTLGDVVQQLNAAIEAAQEEIGFTNTVWAYIPEQEQGLGDDIIVQIDTWNDYRQYNTGGNVGCELTHVTWEDMPSSSSYLRVTGAVNGGYLSLSKFIAYYEKSGSTPTKAQVPGSAATVNRAAFEESEFCAELRDYYGTYEAFCEAEFKIRKPQKFGAFALPGGREMTRLYGMKWAPTKDGSRKFKFPALHYAAARCSDDFALGECWLPSVDEGCYLMNDDTLAKLAVSIGKMGTTAITNATTRWFAERYSATGAWDFGATGGALSNNTVYNSHRCQAVTLFTLNK